MISIKGVDTGNRLVIFDLDDTLVTTDAKIKIVDRHTGKIIKEIIDILDKLKDDFPMNKNEHIHILDTE